MQATAKRSFSYMVNFDPGDTFEGTLNQVEQLVAAGNLEAPPELKDLLKDDTIFPSDPLKQAQQAQSAPIMSQKSS